MEVQIRGTELAKVIRNAMLWQESGVKWTAKSAEEQGGRVLLSFSVDELSLYATDGFAAVRDHIEYTEELPHFSRGKTFEFWFTEDEMDGFLMMAVDSKTGPLTIRFTPDEHVELPYSYTPEDKETKTKSFLGDGVVFFGEPCELPEWAEALEDALEIAEHPQDGDRQLQLDIALRPERLARFLRVRADREAPVDFRFLTPMNEKAGPMAAVKVGHTFRGLVNFVHRSTAFNNLSEAQQDFMWR